LDILIIIAKTTDIVYISNMETNTRPAAYFTESYTNNILAGDRQASEKVIGEALAAHFSIGTIYEHVLTPAQRAVGDLWHAGKIGIAEEHRASEITLDVMRYLRNTAPPRPSLRRRILVTTLSGDLHLIGAKMIADYFHMDGWTVDFLGIDTPTSALLEFASKREPHVIAISVSYDAIVPQLADVVKSLRSLKHKPLIMLGGAALNHTKEKFGSDGVANSPEDAVRLAREIMGLSEVKTSLPEYLDALGKRIQKIRKTQGVSQKALGEASSLDRAYISSLENGKQNVTIGALIKIADALTVPLRELLIEEQIL
jgi:methanogenic corrinoid protein MtbC1/DNA-binding XRE family transcriptional regulator